MSINEAIGSNIRGLRKLKNITQEQLIELIGDENLSLSTLKRIESGNGGFSVDRLGLICEAMNCDLADLFDEEQVNVAIENYCRLMEDEGSVRYMAEIQRLFYPKPSDQVLLQGWPIMSLLQFLIYLPLMDEYWLNNILLCVDGKGFGNEHYIHSKLAYLYKLIPESDAKLYADRMARKCTFDYFMRYISSDATEEDVELLDPEKAQRWVECYDAYSKIIKEKFYSLHKDFGKKRLN